MKHNYYVRTIYDTSDAKAVNLIDCATDLCVAGYHIDYRTHAVDLAYCTKTGHYRYKTFGNLDEMVAFVSRNYENMRFYIVNMRCGL